MIFIFPQPLPEKRPSHWTILKSRRRMSSRWKIRLLQRAIRPRQSPLSRPLRSPLHPQRMPPNHLSKYCTGQKLRATTQWHPPRKRSPQQKPTCRRWSPARDPRISHRRHLALHRADNANPRWRLPRKNRSSLCWLRRNSRESIWCMARKNCPLRRNQSTWRRVIPSERIRPIWLIHCSPRLQLLSLRLEIRQKIFPLSK